MPRLATPGLFVRWMLIPAGSFLLFAGLLTGHAQPTGGESESAKSDNKSDSKSGKTQGAKYARPTDPSLYVGSETCKTCHEDMPVKGFFKHFEDSPHFVTTLDTKKGPEWNGCEACHGPGKAHVDGGGDKTKIFIFKEASAREINQRCLDCHAGGPQHMNAINSEHAKK